MSGLMVRAWILIGGAILIFKYTGILVSSTTSSKIDNLIEGVWVTSKLFDMSVNFIFFILFGWALSSGKDNGSMFAGSSQFACTGIGAEGGGWATVFLLYVLSAIFLIIVTETMRSELLPLHLPYQIITFIVTCVIFPIIVHWAWSDHGWASAYRSSNAEGLLFGCGVLDTGGSGVVHFGGGLTAMAFAMATASGSEWIENFVDTFRNDLVGVEGEGAGDEESIVSRKDTEALKKLKELKDASAVSYNQGIGILLFWIGAYGTVIINLPINYDNAASNVALRAINITMAATAACVAAVVMQLIKLQLRASSKQKEDHQLAGAHQSCP